MSTTTITAMTERSIPDSVQLKINGQLAFLDLALMALAANLGDHKMLTQMVRSVESIRGLCRQHGLAELESLAGELRDWMAQVHLTTGVMTNPQLHLLYRCADTIERAITSQEGESTGANSLRAIREEVRRSALLPAHCAAVA